MKLTKFDVAMMVPFIVMSLIFTFLLIINQPIAIWAFGVGYLSYRIILKYWDWIDKKRKLVKAKIPKLQSNGILKFEEAEK